MAENENAASGGVGRVDLDQDPTLRDVSGERTLRPEPRPAVSDNLDTDSTLRVRSSNPRRSGAHDLAEQERQVGRRAGDKVFRRYELQRVLGRGGMGIVWSAKDLELNREVALKFLPDALAYNEGALADLKRETRRALELTHRHIVRVHDWVSDGEHAAVCMEYVDGKALSTLRALKPSGVFEVEEIREWVGQLCEALEYAHGRVGLVHRDLKPANLMVNAKGELKVTDFGIARSLGETMTRTTGGSGSVSGSPGYMSPQQWQGRIGQPSDDIYSVGATIFELLTGKPPFYTGDVKGQTLADTPPSMAERRRELGLESTAAIPPEWESLVAACLTKEAESRPASAGRVWQLLNSSEPRRHAGETAPGSQGCSSDEPACQSPRKSAQVAGGPRSKAHATETHSGPSDPTSESALRSALLMNPLEDATRRDYLRARSPALRAVDIRSAMLKGAVAGALAAFTFGFLVGINIENRLRAATRSMELSADDVGNGVAVGLCATLFGVVAGALRGRAIASWLGPISFGDLFRSADSLRSTYLGTNDKSD